MKLEVPIKVDIDDVTKLIHDLQCLQTYKLGANDTMVLVSLDEVADVFADYIRGKRLDKDIDVPTKEEAIPVDWIRNYINDLKAMGVQLSLRDAQAVSVMVDKWAMEQKQPTCGPDYCEI